MAPLRWVLLLMFVTAAGCTRGSSTASDGPSAEPSLSPPSHAVVDGSEPRSAPGVRGDRTVTLHEELRANIAVEGVPAEGRRVFLFCHPIATNEFPGPGSGAGWSLENGVGTVPLNHPGPHEVAVEIEGTDVRVRTRPAIVEVGERDGQTHRVAFDHEAFAAALRAKSQAKR